MIISKCYYIIIITLIITKPGLTAEDDQAAADRNVLLSGIFSLKQDLTTARKELVDRRAQLYVVSVCGSDWSQLYPIQRPSGLCLLTHEHTGLLSTNTGLLLPTTSEICKSCM